jgi:hypothetical protein
MKRKHTSKRALLITASAFLVLLAIACGGLYAFTGLYGIDTVLRGGMTYWITVSATDDRLPPAMRLALQTEAIGSPGPFQWQEVGAGFDAGELPVLVDGKEADRILLARIDPHQYRFVVRNAPAGTLEVQDWMERLHAAFVVNGSYFSPHGTPDTPFLSDGRPLGPSDYDARQGAFVASESKVSIEDLTHENWQAAFQGADNALVSYPLLVGSDPAEHEIKPTRWLANRSFVGQDAAGRIILGTTNDAFFSLARLSAFLRSSPLGLIRALNLDGGPVACQAIAVQQFRRLHCGNWEMQDHDGTLKLLRWMHGRWALPIILAALPKQ